jgi:fructose 1,6-bisphosphatase
VRPLHYREARLETVPVQVEEGGPPRADARGPDLAVDMELHGPSDLFRQVVLDWTLHIVVFETFGDMWRSTGPRPCHHLPRDSWQSR